MARRVSQMKKSPPRGKKFWWLTGCGSAAGLVLLIVIITLIRVTSGPSLPREIRQRLAAEKQSSANQPPGGMPAAPAAPSAADGSATPVTRSGSAPTTPSLQGQLSQLKQAQTSGSTAPFTLYIRDTELNQMLAAEQHGPVEQAQAYFGEGKAYVIMAIRHGGRTWNATITATPIIVQGGMQMAVESVKIGSMEAPAAVMAKVQNEINRNSSRYTAEKLGLYVESITVKPGMAILSGRPVRRR